MRLTLRTLLAYLDDVWTPADKEELAQKIQSSDFAEDLVHQNARHGAAASAECTASDRDRHGARSQFGGRVFGQCDAAGFGG